MTFRAAASERSRQVLHMAMGGFALALPYLTWSGAVFCASAALALNLFVIRKLTALFRPGEIARPATSGIVLYPAAVLGLLLVFHDRMDIVAAAWGIMAVGDGMATLAGRRWPVGPLPWNARKSVGGSVAMMVSGAAAGCALAWWCRGTVVPPAYWWFPLAGGIAGAIAAAAAESVPIALDDNITVPATAAAALWCVSLVTEDGIHALSSLTPAVPAALIVNVVVAVAGYRARTVTRAGAVTGAGLGTLIAVCTGWSGWTLLLVTFACAVLTSRMGLRRKLLLGIAEERGGRRGAGNAIANTGVAAVAAGLAILGYTADGALLGFVAALAAGGSDTVASEIGKAWGRRTYLITSARAVPPGTPGALSLEGTAAGLGSAALLGALGIVLGLVPPAALLPVIAGATIGSVAESVMGATLEPRRIVNNDVLNFLNTAIGAWAAIALSRLL